LFENEEITCLIGKDLEDGATIVIVLYNNLSSALLFDDSCLCSWFDKIFHFLAKYDLRELGLKLGDWDNMSAA
jgi:hypothetical protein